MEEEEEEEREAEGSSASVCGSRLVVVVPERGQQAKYTMMVRGVCP